MNQLWATAPCAAPALSAETHIPSLFGSKKVFTPNHHWPHYNSDNDPDMRKFGYRKNGFMMTLQYLFDVSGTKRERREYDRARPFAVIGGVSEREALMLQSTRGGLAKTALVFMWLNEFVIREQMHGSLGGVAPPIVSRLQQYASDGHFWYNAARKMSYIPIPFPHQQLAALFEIISIFLLPVLMLSKTQVYFGFCLNFVTVLLLNGLNELAKVRIPRRCYSSRPSRPSLSERRI